MHMKKTRKTAAVMLLAMAAVTMVIAAFYINYEACFKVIPLSSSSLLQKPYNSSAADSEPNRSKLVSSSASCTSKLYIVCETHDHIRSTTDLDIFSNNRRRIVDSTSGTVNKSPGIKYSINGGSDIAHNGDRGNGTTLIYFITPTYPRREQIAELTRLGQTLMHVSRLYWIVADDRPDCSLQIMSLLPDFSENNVQ